MKTQRRSLLGGLAVVATVIALVSGVLQSTPASAANPSAGFDPANVIDDSLFYNGSAMTASQVQSFLNQQVPKCWLGSPGYEVGKAVTWGGTKTKLASKCTRDYSLATPSRAANSFCAAYVGSSKESAAQIVAKVGKACGISQRVLLITLQKEQSLITDPWPNEEQYRRAMGYACPDSGPGGTANCDPSKGGFFEQVYRAAWQLKVYKAFPKDYNYQPNRSNYIQWHPNAACGGSNVTIKNSATAALYIYTPYRPNTAALNAGWGEGDTCSSYGVRNFYNYYNSWFGKPTGPKYPVTGAIAEYWMSQAGGWLGEPHGTATSVTANGGGRVQTFANGVVFEPKKGSLSALMHSSPLFKAYTASGGVAASWGWPIAFAVNQGATGENTMQFQNGLAVESAGSANLVPQSLVAAWQKAGGLRGSLGAPKAAAKTSGNTTSQLFAKGTLVKVGGNTPVTFDSGFVAAWENGGGGNNPIGLPAGAPASLAANGGGQEYSFTNGKMYKSKSGVFTFVSGRMLTLYGQNGGPAGAWGWPTGKPLCTADGRQCSGTFSNGIVSWTDTRGALFTPSATPMIPNLSPGNGESVAGGVVE